MPLCVWRHHVRRGAPLDRAVRRSGDAGPHRETARCCRINFSRKDRLVPIPVQFHGRLSIPAVAAPMFLVSNPDLVVEACRAGIIGTFPALNRRSSADYEAWLVEIRERLQRYQAAK